MVSRAERHLRIDNDVILSLRVVGMESAVDNAAVADYYGLEKILFPFLVPVLVFRLRNGVTDAWDVVDVTINQLYLELPLMVGARIHTASNFDLLFKGGPYLAYGVGGKTKIDGVSEKADTFGDDGLKRFDAGLGLGVAFEFGNIVVGVETGTSFTKVASGVSAHNLSALATIGYKF